MRTNILKQKQRKKDAGEFDISGGNMRTGEQLKEEGIKIVLSRNESWSEHIMHVLETFCADRKKEGKPLFAFEEFRRHCRCLGVAEPRSHKAWGAVALEASRKGIIEWTGAYVPAKPAKTHGHPVKIWRGA